MGSCAVKITESIPSLPKQEQMLARYILRNLSLIPMMSITDLAKACHSSPSTICRYSRFLGFEGYPDLSKAIFLEVSSPELSIADVPITDKRGKKLSPTEQTIRDVSLGNAEAIRTSFQILDARMVDKVVNLLDKAGKICFYGIGGSAITAREAMFKFQRIGLDCQAYGSFQDQILSAAILTPKDVAFFISYSGESTELMKTLKIASDNKAATVGLTKYSSNRISRAVKYCLHHASVADGKRTNNTKSSIAQLNVLDILFTLLAKRRNEDLEHFYKQAYEVFPDWKKQ